MGSELMVSIPPIAAITWLILFFLKKIGVPTRFFPLISNLVALGIAILVAVKSGEIDIIEVLAQAVAAGAMAVQGEDIKDRIFQNKKYAKIEKQELPLPSLVKTKPQIAQKPKQSKKNPNPQKQKSAKAK